MVTDTLINAGNLMVATAFMVFAATRREWVWSWLFGFCVVAALYWFARWGAA